MQPTSHQFQSNVRRATVDVQLRTALDRAKTGFINNRLAAVTALPEFEELRKAAREIKEHTLNHLDFYLERFEREVESRGGHVHWASTPARAREIIVDICKQTNARCVTKGKSMVGEEVSINEALEQSGLDVIETDLGEYIIQLANEPPSHIIAPAIHKTRGEIGELFHKHHEPLGYERVEHSPEIVHQARQVLRSEFLRADVGITGANFLIAETGSVVLVTNEGNGDLSNTLPRVHIVTAGIEKVLPNFEDLSTVLRLLARSATGQETSTYTTVTTGPKRATDLDGPEEFHIVLLDNGRSKMLEGDFHEMLRCIRCGSCLNHCPVYHSIGGHAYGWVYSGPMGSVLTPLILGLDAAHHLPNACTLNGRCQEVCPMSIPLPSMLRKLRFRAFDEGLTSRGASIGLSAWAFLAKRPSLYRSVTRIIMKALGMLGRRRGRFAALPFAGGWTRSRDLPAPQGETFQAAWARHKGVAEVDR
jgi:L-lactate dehydrogenase complex protein LldF